MTQLIKNIEGVIYSEHKSTIVLKKSVDGEIQIDDYISLNGIVMCLQNFSLIEDTSRLSTQLTLGLENKYNIELVKLEIDAKNVSNILQLGLYE